MEAVSKGHKYPINYALLCSLIHIPFFLSMNLVIDQGNTICKLAFFGEENELLSFQVCPQLNVPFLADFLKEKHPQAGILSTVKDLNPEITDYLKFRIPGFILFDHHTPLPVKNAYHTPQTLGLDRMAAAVGAWSLQPGKPLLIVDMGTAVTFDFVSEDGTYMGGNIAPGMQMRLKSLHEYTDKLPLVEAGMDFSMLGEDTQTAIRSGVMQGLFYEIEGYYKDLHQQHPNLFAFLTGGDLFYFEEKLKNGIFVCKNLVLIGLNRILHNNVHP